MIYYAILGVVGLLLLGKKEEISDAIEVRMDSWTQFDSFFKKSAQKYSVDWTWLKAIALNESSLGKHPRVARGLLAPKDIEGSKSEDGKSWGLMQVTVPTARDFDKTATEEKLNNAEYSIDIAAKFIAFLKKQFPPNDPRLTEWIIKSYNQGAGNTKKERSGAINGYAGQYWDKFQKNLTKVKENLT